MGFKQNLRNRFENNLSSHQIDDDYTVPRRSHSAVVLNQLSSHSQQSHRLSPLSQAATTHPLSNAHSHSFASFTLYDPHEQVPSYESVVLLLLHPLALAGSQPHHQHTGHPPSFDTPNEIAPQLSSTSSSLSLLTIPTHPTTPPTMSSTHKLKQLGLKFLNARQHFALAVCRDLSLVPPLIGLFQSWKRVFFDPDPSSILTSARISEHFLTGVWCIVSSYLSYSVLDGLIVRWIVTYSTSAAIVRVLLMSTIIATVEQYLVATFTATGYKYGLHIWILISCLLTLAYIAQNFITSNIDLKGKRRARFFDFYNIAVFAVVPVGMASFLTMVVLLRSLLILRIDIEGLVKLTGTIGTTLQT